MTSATQTKKVDSHLYGELRIAKEHHEAKIHVVLLMTVKKRQARIIRHELNIYLRFAGNENGVFEDTVRFAAS